MIFFVIWIQKKPSSESLKNIAPPLPWESDAYLQPTVPDDGLLQYGVWYFFTWYCNLIIYHLAVRWKMDSIVQYKIT